MKLSEIRNLHAPRTEQREFVFDKFDHFEGTMTQYIEPFDVLVSYECEDGGYTDHPYGEGSAREHHGFSCEVTSVTADEEVKIFDEDEKLIRTIPKGTDLKDIPGYTKDFEKFFQKAAEQHGD